MNTTATSRVGRPPKQDDVDRRALVLEAAILKTSEVGFEAVKLSDIGEQAGVAPALVRHYFDNKEGLFSACNEIVGQRLEELFGYIKAAASRAPKGEILQAFVDAMRENFQEERVVLGYLCWLFLKGGREADRLYQIYHDAIAEIVDELKVRGVVSDKVPTYWFVQQNISIQMGPYFLTKPIGAQLGRDPFDPDVVQERSVAMLHTLKAAAIHPPEYHQ